MAKFNVGDIVVIVQYNFGKDCSKWYSVGQIGIVTESAKAPFIRFSMSVKYVQRIAAVTEDNLKLLEDITVDDIHAMGKDAKVFIKNIEALLK